MSNFRIARELRKIAKDLMAGKVIHVYPPSGEDIKNAYKK